MLNRTLLLTEDILDPNVFFVMFMCVFVIKCVIISCVFFFHKIAVQFDSGLKCSFYETVQCENVFRSVFILITVLVVRPPWRSLCKGIDAVMSVYKLVTGNKDNKTGPSRKVSSHFCLVSTEPILPVSSYQVLRVNLKYKV